METIIVSIFAIISLVVVIFVQHKMYKNKETKIKEEYTEKMEKAWEVIKDNEKKKSEILSGDTVSDFNAIMDELQNLSGKNKS